MGAILFIPALTPAGEGSAARLGPNPSPLYLSQSLPARSVSTLDATAQQTRAFSGPLNAQNLVRKEYAGS